MQVLPSEEILTGSVPFRPLSSLTSGLWTSAEAKERCCARSLPSIADDYCLCRALESAAGMNASLLYHFPSCPSFSRRGRRTFCATTSWHRSSPLAALLQWLWLQHKHCWQLQFYRNTSHHFLGCYQGPN